MLPGVGLGVRPSDSAGTVPRSLGTLGKWLEFGFLVYKMRILTALVLQGACEDQGTFRTSDAQSRVRLKERGATRNITIAVLINGTEQGV